MTAENDIRIATGEKNKPLLKKSVKVNFLSSTIAL